jgi:hypothetical protein
MTKTTITSLFAVTLLMSANAIQSKSKEKGISLPGFGVSQTNCISTGSTAFCPFTSAGSCIYTNGCTNKLHSLFTEDYFGDVLT